MIDIDKFKRLENEIIDESENNPYSFFGLSKEFPVDNPARCDKLITNYDKETEKLFKIIVSYFDFIKKYENDNLTDEKSSVKVPNKKIAIVGVSGVGKTTVVNNLVKIFNEGVGKLQVLDYMNYVIMFGNKFGDVGYINERLMLEDSLKKGVFIFDDIQFGYYPQNIKKSKKVKVQKDFFDEVNSKIKNSVFISIWDIFGFEWKSKQDSDFTKQFDEIIFISGLKEGKMDKMLNKRLNYYSLQSGDYDIKKFFDSDVVGKLIKKSSKNPRYFIYLASKALELAFDSKKDKVSLSILNNILEKELEDVSALDKIDFTKSDQLILDSLLTTPNKMNRKEIRQFTNLETSTITKRLRVLVKSKLVRETKKTSGNKMYYYSLAPLYKLKKELEISNRLEEGFNKLN